MINLIPPEAKKRVTKEYWLRVVSVWSLSGTMALIASICILVPAYVLITIQISANEGVSQAASEKVAEFESVTKELSVANQKAKAVLENNRFEPVSPLVAMVRAHESAEVRVSQITVSRTKDGFAPIVVAGEADSRQALAAFRDRLLNEPNVSGVDLPISNLAKDKEIQFSLTITVKKPT
ncbi:MAG: hypothetical protein RL538_736 [Candidatus Parcubacteria bacterium]|jgi:hypothetical protein